MIINLFNINENTKIFYSLIQVYGINKSRSLEICKMLGYDLNTSYKVLTFEDKYKLNQVIEIKNKYLLESDLKKKNLSNIKFIKKIRTYKGIRHILLLPVNGQRSKTNAKTQK